MSFKNQDAGYPMPDKGEGAVRISAHNLLYYQLVIGLTCERLRVKGKQYEKEQRDSNL